MQTSSTADWYMSVCEILDLIVYLQAKLKKKQEAANAKILEAEKRIKVSVCFKWNRCRNTTMPIMNSCHFKLQCSKSNHKGVTFLKQREIKPVCRDFLCNTDTIEMYWSPVLSLLFLPYQEKELRRQQAEILKHQVGIPNNFFFHLNVLVQLKAFFRLH